MANLELIDRAAEALRARGGSADIAVILGSGLGDYVEALKDAVVIPYADIPGFPRSTAPGHAGEMHIGTLRGKRVMMMRGRFHGYEGYDMDTVTFPIRVMARAGIKALFVTNAAGGVNPAFEPGDLMLITDHINLTGKNPLIGPNLDEMGPRFPDMTHAYDPELMDVARIAANSQGFVLREGVYLWLNGPCYETPAEIRMCAALGADAVGMSTVPEVIVARHAGMRVLGISCITNMAAGILDQPLCHEEVLETGHRVRNRFSALLTEAVAKAEL